MAITALQQTEITKIVAGLFNAAPGAGYLTSFAGFVGTPGNTTAMLADALGNSAAFQTVMAGKVTVAAQVTQLMSNFGLTYAATTPADVAAQAWFTAQVTAGATFGSMVFNAVSFLSLPATLADPVYGATATMLANKAAVAEYYSATLASGTTASTLAQLQAVVSGVTATTPVATAVDLQNALNANGAAVGTTFTLVAGLDNISGTAANDTIVGILDTTPLTANATLSAADTINGGQGTDTLSIISQGGTANSIPAASISSVEVINVRAVSTGSFTGAIGGILGVTNVNADRSTDAVSWTGLAAGVTAGIIGNGVVGNGSSAIGYADAATAAAINISAGTTVSGGTLGAVSVTGLGLTTATINSLGAANTIGTLGLTAGTTALTINATTALTTGALTAAGLLTLTTTGAGAVDVSAAALATTVTAVNASANAGGTSVLLGANTTSFTGGAGNDSVNLGTFVFNGTGAAATKVAGGLGTGDSLTIALATQLTAATAANISGFENLSLAASTGQTFDVSLLAGITSVGVAASTNVTVNNLSAVQAAAVTVSGTQTTNAAFGVTGAATVGQLDTLSLAINDGAAPVSTITMANITAAGVETINLALTDNLIVNTATGMGAFTAINVTGAGTLSLTSGIFAANVNSVINATAATGIQSIDVSGLTTNGVSIKGSTTANNAIFATAQADLITAGNAINVIWAGAGADTITVGTGSNLIYGGAGADAINFGLHAAGKVDSIAFAAVGDSYSNVATIVSGTTVLSGSVDVVNGMHAGDTIGTIFGAVNAATVVNTAIMASGAVDAVAIVHGTYSAATGIFTSGAAGLDALVQYDANGAVGAGTIESVVLVGVGAAATLTAGTNLLTLA